MNIVSLIIALLIFSVIVIFHELGHFWLAKANGIRVNEFSLGLGPTIVGFTKGGDKVFHQAASVRWCVYDGR